MPPDVHPVIFDSIDAAMIRSSALNTRGAAGPSGLDAEETVYILQDSFQGSLPFLGRHRQTSLFDFCRPKLYLTPLACRLIALDKNPGVRSIGIGETARHIIAKAVLTVTRSDIQDAAGSVQLCAGQIAGAESAVHAVRESFKRDGTDAVLLVDASNAFNSISRNAALHNNRFDCPAISTILINTYRAPS